MKFSEYWLREWINPKIDSNSLIKQITMSGLEVNNIRQESKLFTDVVVGKIVKCLPYPNKKELYITKVDIGNKKLLNIICNFANCRINLLVAVAKINSYLHEADKVKYFKFFDKSSEGIICSLSILGLEKDNNDIFELPKDAKIGQDLFSYLKLDDKIIDINVTPNRADCLSILGIARDISVLNKMPLRKLNVKTISSSINDIIDVHIEERKKCPKYLVRIIKNINIESLTPIWMKEKLRRCGLKSINTIIDISNYVLLELGQPTHIFDYNCVKGGIVVRNAKNGEILNLTNNKYIVLNSDTLVIADHEKILALAGIIGSNFCSIKSCTKDIVLESAFFKPNSIIGRARYYGLDTDSSYRYERGVDPKLQLKALERVTNFIVSICNGQPGPITNITHKTFIKKKINIILYRKSLDKLIGFFIPDKDIDEILINLGFKIYHSKTAWKVLVPSWRFDISIEEDLIEEIIRIYGYDSILKIPIKSNLLVKKNSKSIISLSRIKSLLIDRGYQEIITYSFVNPKIQILFHPKQNPLTLPNPISSDMSVMRLSLWTGLINTLINNKRRQQKNIRFFETGLCFIPNNKLHLEISQKLMIAGIITGSRFEDHWDYDNKQLDFYDIKGDIESIFELTGKLDDINFVVKNHDALHPGQSATIYLKNEIIGYIGAIHPKIESILNLNEKILIFEIIWEKISNYNIPKLNNISIFPSNSRDISLIVSTKIAAGDIISECKKIILDKLVDIKLFDVYQGINIPKGFKSLSIRLILQDYKRTLKDNEISDIIKKCTLNLKNKFNAFLRD